MDKTEKIVGMENIIQVENTTDGLSSNTIVGQIR